MNIRKIGMSLTLLIIVYSCQVGNDSGGDDPIPDKPVDNPVDGPVDKVFFDDFDTFNGDSWTAIERGASWNNEDQAYSPDNVWVENGNLVIESRRENWIGAPNLPHHEDNNLPSVERAYTSGQVESKNKFYFTYGKVEVRAKMQTTPGMLNAIWMVTEAGEWPPEIDIAEQLGHEPNKLYTTSHYGTQADHKINSGHYDAGVNLSDDYHIYGIEWDENEIRWYLDGVQVFSATAGVPNEPFYLIFCPAIGPDWTGDPTAESQFPLRYMIDWVRVEYRQ